MNNLIGIVVSYIFIAVIMVLAKFFEKKDKEVSRKFIHILLGIWWFIAMYFFDNVIAAAFVPLTFVIINYISNKKDLISVMERNEDKKDGLGTVYYAISLFILSIITFGPLKRPELGLIAVLIMSYGDGLAAVIGKNVESKKYKIGNSEKSVAGSATMFIITFTLVALYLALIASPFWFIKSLIASLIITVIEAVSIKGLDNITVPILSFILLLIIA